MSAIMDRLCVRVVVGVQLKVTTLFDPAVRLNTVIFWIGVFLSYSWTAKLPVMSVDLMLDMVTVMV